MAKKTKELSLKEKIKLVWEENNLEFRTMWKESWAKYKTIIGPFIKGTATYAWNLIYGSLAYISRGLYKTGTLVVDYLISLVEKA